MQLPPFKQPASGDVVGDYRLETKLGDGGQGLVFKAECAGRFFVLKFFHTRGRDVWGLREVSILQKFRHPHIVRVHGYGRWPDPETGWFYIAMEWVEGLTLEEYALVENPGARKAASILLTVARTLGEVHRRGVLHRDLKRENILVRARDGEPVLVDFGIGVVSGATPLPYCGLLPPATHEFVSPEAWLFLGENVGESVRYESTVADDLWALGVTFYWLLTNHLPFGTRHSHNMVKAILGDTPKAPHACNPRVPQALSAVCMRMLEKEPAARYPDTQALCAALEAALAEGDERWDVPLGDPDAPEERTTEVVPGLVKRSEEELLLRQLAAPPRRGRKKPPAGAPRPPGEERRTPVVAPVLVPEALGRPAPAAEVMAPRMAAVSPAPEREGAPSPAQPAAASVPPAAAPARAAEECAPRRPWLSRAFPTLVGPLPVRAVAVDGMRRAAPVLLLLAVVAVAGVGALLASTRGHAAESRPGGNSPGQVAEKSWRSPEEITSHEVCSSRELAVSLDSFEAGDGAAPLGAPIPASVFATAMLRKEDSSVNPPEKSAPPPQRKGLRARVKEVCVGAACCALLGGCAGGAPVRPTPKPAECPAGAVETMTEQLDIDIGDRADISFPVVGSSKPVTVREFTPVELRRPLGRLEPGTELSGRLIFGQERVYGRFTHARTPAGQTYKVCIELTSRAGQRGVEIKREAGPDSVVVFSSQDVRAVRRFE